LTVFAGRISAEIPESSLPAELPSAADDKAHR